MIKTWQQRHVENSHASSSYRLNFPTIMQAEINELRAELKRLEEQKPVAKVPQCHLTGKCDCDAYCSTLVGVYLAAGARE